MARARIMELRGGIGMYGPRSRIINPRVRLSPVSEEDVFAPGWTLIKAFYLLALAGSM